MSNNDISTVVVQKIQQSVTQIIQGQLSIQNAIDQCSELYRQLWTQDGYPDLPMLREQNRLHMQKLILLSIAKESEKHPDKDRLSIGECALCDAHLLYARRPGDSSKVICRECLGSELYNQIPDAYSQLSPAERQAIDYLASHP